VDLSKTVYSTLQRLRGLPGKVLDYRRGKTLFVVEYENSLKFRERYYRLKTGNWETGPTGSVECTPKLVTTKSRKVLLDQQ